MTEHVIPIDRSEQDPGNARRRTERSAGMISKSLRKFGPLRSLVGQVTPEGKIMIRAGNGTWEEASQMGIEKLRVVKRKKDELVVVVADDLTEEQWAQYAIADNRSSDLSDWHTEQLIATHEDVDLSDWFAKDEIKAWLEEEDLPDEGEASTEEVIENWAIMITCTSEQQQVELLERLQAEGIECQALIS